ncbi:hypothetical protein LTR09_004857 [Extremus antarcticus]|uniref:GTP-binding protein 8 n=1 Tax=Extremus antarcticus TaxID=702011 RepID=A0AAJ0DQ19_9PEZI|nr:hypothetical protein LTR09_004857 [Extremus antarcticus]
MDLLRLPPPLRRTLLSSPHLIRLLTTQSRPTAPPLLPISLKNSQPTSFPPSTAKNSRPNLTLSSSALNPYTLSPPPNPTQLKYASTFFHSSPPHLLYSAAHFRTLPPLANPEIAFLGRSNVGKSSLLNALFGRPNIKDAHVSKRPGRTRTMNGFGVLGPGQQLGAASSTGERGKEALWKRFPVRGGLVVVDMPGYGAGSREIWGQEVLKFLEKRRQLRRTFVLVDAEHGLKKSDLEILVHLKRAGVPCQVVLSKVDKLLWAGPRAPGAQRLQNRMGMVEELRRKIGRVVDEDAGDGRKGLLGDVLCCSAEKGLGGGRKLGVDEVRWEVLKACGMDCDEGGQRRQYSLEDLNILEDEAE